MKDFKSKGIVVLALILASLISAYFVVFANYQAMAQAKAELLRVNQDKENLDHSLKLLESFLDKYRSLSKEAKLAKLALPTSSEPALLLGEIEQLAKLSGILISSVNFIDSPEAEIKKLSSNSVVSTEAQLSISGNYFSFRDFLDRLENHIRIIDLQLVSISVEEKNNNYQYEIKFKTYYQK